MGKTRKKRPTVRNAPALPYDEPPNFDKHHPVFCLQHVVADFDVKTAGLADDSKAAFADQLQSLSSLTWDQIRRAPRHGLGFEKMPVSSLNMTMPDTFADEDHVLVFRYNGKLPMCGVRRQATLHILALEKEFGDLYDH